MKLKTLLLILLLPFMVEAQTTYSPQRYAGAGDPITSKPEKGAHYLDTLRNVVWIKIGQLGNKKWAIETDSVFIRDFLGGGGVGAVGPQGPKGDTGANGRDGAQGSQGIAGPQGIQGTTGAKGDKGDTGNTGAQGPKGDKGDTGAMGPQGPAGSGGSGSSTTRIITSNLIEEFGTIVIGGVNSTKTVSEAGYSSANYPGYSISNSDQFDWANLQYAMYLESQSGKKVQTYGIFKGIPKMVDLGTTNYYLVLEGVFAHFYTSNNNAFAVFGRTTPANMTEANLMIQAQYDISNLNIHAQSNQIGFQPGPTYTSTFKSINVEGAKTGVWLQFNLNCTVTNSMLTNCTNGVLLDMLDAAKTSGATNANSQSNHSSVTHCRVYGNGEIGFGAVASSGTSFIDDIVEGLKYKYPYFLDGKNSTVVKNGYYANNHYEGVLGVGLCGSGEAMFKVRLLAGTITVNDVFAQYAGCAIDAQGTAAAVVVHLEKTNWLVTPSDGKLFYNAGNTVWHFGWNTVGDIMNPSTISSRFAGTPVNQCGGWACGNNKWWIDGLGVVNGGGGATAAKMVAEPEPKYTVTLTMNKAKFMAMHPYLRSQLMAEAGSHVYHVETLELANEIIAANPDFIGTIK